MRRPNRLSRAVPSPGPALAGPAPTPSFRFSPAAPAARAATATAPNRRPRPATTRYPIPAADFLILQQEASLPTAPASLTVHKPDAAIVPDAAASALPAAPTPAPLPAPTVTGAFPGIPNTGWAPPDCAIACGRSFVLLAVNSSLALYDKMGTRQWQMTLDEWFVNVVQGHKIFDPRLAYDQYEDRWILVAAALGPDGTQTSLFLLSVSETDDPNGHWQNYALDATVDGSTATNNWGDYPTLGLDDKALYITANMFQFNGGFEYAKIRIIDKRPPYAGSPVTFTDIPHLKNPDGSAAFTVQPCHTYGKNPDAQYFVSAIFPGSDELVLWTLKNPLDASPAINAETVPVSAYGLPPKAEQPGSGLPIETGDSRMQNAVFRDNSVWAALTTRHNWDETMNRAAIHWFEIDPSNPGGPALKQQGVYGAAGAHYYYPAIMPDVSGNAIIIFGRSGSSEFASANVTGRAASDALGDLRPSASLMPGLATYTGIQRWGDYAGAAIDPSGESAVWVHTGRAGLGGNWETVFGSAHV